LEIRAVEITGSHIGDGERCSAIGSSAPRTCYPICSARSRRTRRLAASRQTAPTTRASAMMQSRVAAPMPSSHPAKMRSHGRPSRRCRPAKQGPAGLQIPRPGPLATMERIPPPEPRRNEDALCQTAGPDAHGAGLRPSSCRTPGPYCCAERPHRARHPCHRGRGIGPSGERGTPTISRFVQQSLS